MDALDGQVLAAQEQRVLMRDWMRQQNLEDPGHPDFALTPRARRLRARGTEGESDPKVSPVVTAFVVPPPPWPHLWAASDATIFTWLADKARRYEPFANSAMFPGEPK